MEPSRASARRAATPVPSPTRPAGARPARPPPPAVAQAERCTVSRRQHLVAVTLPALLLCQPTPAVASADEDGAGGVGTSPARRGDLVLVHYVGTLDDGTVFDSTRGGLGYRDGGAGIVRPVTFLLGGSPLPGIVQGLAEGVQGMRVGGRRRLTVAPAQGFGDSQAVLAPYAVVPPGSTLHYEVELLRLSRQGPDALMAGVAGCGLGGASQRTQGCEAITPAEFL